MPWTVVLPCSNAVVLLYVGLFDPMSMQQHVVVFEVKLCISIANLRSIKLVLIAFCGGVHDELLNRPARLI
jgi:hypothetical protein